MTRALCPVCHEWRGARVPRGGDGSAVRINKHNRLRSINVTHGSITTEECPGSYRTATDTIESWEELKSR